jgi:hypothetical protein
MEKLEEVNTEILIKRINVNIALIEQLNEARHFGRLTNLSAKRQIRYMSKRIKEDIELLISQNCENGN